MKKRSDYQTLFYGSHNQKKLDGPLIDELGTSTGPWPRYLVMNAPDEGKTLSKLSPFAIHKGLKGIAGGDVTIKRQFSGDIYLTCSKKIPIGIIYSSVFCLAVLPQLL